LGELSSFPQPPQVSYTPEERPISFTFPFNPKSPFDRKSASENPQSDQQNLLDDIDDAIDEFMYTLPATTYKTLPATTYSPELEPTTYTPEANSKIYTPEPVLSNATYDPKHERKDSVMPYLDKELPPVPLKDEKYRKGSLRG
jgi:hypothetical protein